MTSIEWLFNELWDEPKDKFTWYSILNKALEKHKQEIIDAYNNGDLRSADLYYQEIFVSKGSDEHICTYEKCPQCLKAQLPQQETLYTEEQVKLAYMQGYNRGKDGNPNHMESYIKFLKQPKQ